MIPSQTNKAINSAATLNSAIRFQLDATQDTELPTVSGGLVRMGVGAAAGLGVVVSVGVVVDVRAGAAMSTGGGTCPVLGVGAGTSGGANVVLPLMGAMIVVRPEYWVTTMVAERA